MWCGRTKPAYCLLCHCQLPQLLGRECITLCSCTQTCKQSYHHDAAGITYNPISLRGLDMQIGVDYIIPHLTVNGTTSLANNPIVEVAASTGRADMFLGGNFVFNSGSNQVTNWTVGAGIMSQPA